jgi:DmsE family decaheme c-type cytochrome
MVDARSRHTLTAVVLGVAFFFLLAQAAESARPAKPDFKLKAGARGKLCVDCHDGFEDVLKKSSVHTPVAKGDCSGCHNPHTSDHEMLLAAERGDICYECHDDIVTREARSVHQVVVEGKCVSCHDPHAADNEMNLLRAGSKLCFECHVELGERIAGDKFEHDPVTEDCLDCHNPHASAENRKLLKDAEPTLCLECHETDKATFKKLHEQYPVQKARCTLCHDPHGSNTGAILFDNVHDPVLDRKCKECHVAPTSASPFALKNSGYELCEGCHYEMVADAFNKKRPHWPLVDKTGCINCHAPHASPQGKLLKEPMLAMCGRCHGDTVARQERSRTKHPPVADGECTACHSPHGSDNLFIINEPSYLELCETCHEWQTHSTHPIGTEVIDPRNKNITLQCLSCHRTHGTEYKHFIYFGTTNEMCVQCHTDYRR